MSAEPIPFFATAREHAAHRDEVLAAIDAALAGGRSLQGPPVAELEAELARRAGRAHAVGLGSGTDALAFALLAAGVGPGDEVIVPALSFIATASCVLRAGATPVFADVDEAGLLDLASAAALVTGRTRACIAVQLFGQMADPAALEAFAARHDLALVEDAAQALGAERDGRRAGGVGLASCLSFDPTKTVAAPGSGGALLCDDAALAERVRRLRWHGRDASGAFAELGFNSQLPSAAAAVLRVKLEHDAAWTGHRAAIAGRYDAALEGVAGTAPLPRVGGRHVFHKYVVRTAPERRDPLRERLDAAGIPTLVHYARVLPDQPVFAALPATEVPVARALAGSVVSLPIHPFLRSDEVDRVVEALAGG